MNSRCSRAARYVATLSLLFASFAHAGPAAHLSCPRNRPGEISTCGWI